MTVPPLAAAGLSVVTSDRAEGLIERLAADLGAAPLSPFDDEIVVVQSQGMRRWLRHELARRHGCAASIQFPFPTDFCKRIAGARALGQRAIDPRFERDALVWRILELFESEIADERGFEPLRRFLSDDDARKGLGLATRVAARFDDYQLYRPDTLLAWEDEAAAANDDSHTTAHERWQAEAWRRLCAGDEPPMHLARWFSEGIARLESLELPVRGGRSDAIAGLPRRVTVFGISTLPPLFVRLLRALSRIVPVRFYVLATPRVDGAARNPLVAAFGGTVSELLDVTGAGAVFEEIHEHSVIEPSTALRRLQDDARRGVSRGPEPGMAPPVPLRAVDDSLTVHVCHSPMREMEVLRDQLLAAFAADPRLRPHDILVLVPDVTLYAPFIEAVFDVGEPELPRIPHHVADRTVVHESSIADSAIQILRLVGARWTATEVVELLDVPAVRRAAGLDGASNDDVLRWLRDTRIRWGRDGAMRRERFDLPAVESNSWSAGIERLLMGYAVGPNEQLFAGILPSAGATMGNPAMLGAFAQWIERLFAFLDDCRRARPLGEWGRDLHDAFAALIVPDDDEGEAHQQLMHVVDSLAEIQTTALAARDVDVALIRDWLEHSLADDRVGSGFLIGGMTVCALKPMRSIPFRVIAIAGLDDAAFPRRNRRAAYDLLEIEPRRNDRNLRADDRQLFFDTLLSARDRLILSYVGRSTTNNDMRAASVVIAELLDQVDRSFTCDGGARNAIVTEHKLQPFSAAYYGSERSDAPAAKYFSYSRANARATEVASAERQSAAPFVRLTLAEHAPVPAEYLNLSVEDLIGCWVNPSKFYVQQTLRVSLLGDDDPVEDCEPMSFDGLTKYGFDERMLRRHLSGHRSPSSEREQALADGLLPSGEMAGLWVDRQNEELACFLARVGRPAFGEPVVVELRGNEWMLIGRIDGVVDGGRAQVRAARRKPKDLVRAWITHLALSAASGPMRTRIIGTDGESHFDRVDDPMALLETLIAGYRAAAATPIPVFEQASHEYVDRLRKAEAPVARKGGRPSTKSAIDCARDRYRTSEWARAPGDDADAYHALCWRGRDPFAPPSNLEFEKWSQLFWRPALAALVDGAPESAS